jgi:RNA 2',3'-cyclic 3'-phosphodiesterase
MSDLIRSFVAVDVSQAVLGQVRDLLVGLKKVTPGDVKWVKPELMHLTLAFLGEVGAEFIQSAQGRLVEVAAGCGPIQCRLGGLGAFPSSTRARVLWAGMEQGADGLCRLQRNVATSLETVGYVPERRPYSPHLTLSRFKFPTDVSRVVTTGFESDEFRVDRLVLYRSVLALSGPTYSRLAEFPLGPPA